MTIAQVKAQRQLKLRQLLAALKDYDGRQEAFERLLIRYRGKRKMIEAEDIPPLTQAFANMNQKFGAVENELVGLGRLVAI